MSEQNALTTPGNKQLETMSSFNNSSGFDLLLRQAKMLSSSSLVPEQFSIFKNGQLKSIDQQAYAQANCAIVIEMAARLNASPLMVAQNLYVVHGRPGWSSQFIIASVSSSGRFSPLRFDVSGDGDQKTCIAWAIENRTGERLESPPVSIDMAKKEGWYGKNGSKWQTMPELMLRYRAAAFFGRLYAPDLLMGIKSVEEESDIGDNLTPIEKLKEAVETEANQGDVMGDDPPDNVDKETGEIKPGPENTFCMADDDPGY
jgi:hypothetical protein